MPKVKLYDMTGKELGTKDLSETVFGIEPNMAVLHEAVRTSWPTSVRALSPPSPAPK